MCFQSTPPRRRRQLKNWNVALLYNFQSTPPRRRRQPIYKRFSQTICFQSTPPRRRRQKVDSEELDSVTFSINASAKEATTPQAKHTPLWAFFNPRLREGGDEQWCPDISENPEFSIHASAKEATFS